MHSSVGETHHAERIPLASASILRGYVSLLRDRQFIVPAASVSTVIGGLFAVFTVTPAILVDGLGFTPLALSLFYAGTVFIVFGAGFAAPRLAQRAGLAAVTRAGLIIASTGCVLMALLALAGFGNFASYLLPMLVFLFGMGLVNPIGTALTLSPFGDAGRICFSAARLPANGSSGVGDRRRNGPAGIALSCIVSRPRNPDDRRFLDFFLACMTIALAAVARCIRCLEGWRTAREIDEERVALKALRGDFRAIGPAEGDQDSRASQALRSARR